MVEDCSTSHLQQSQAIHRSHGGEPYQPSKRKDRLLCFTRIGPNHGIAWMNPRYVPCQSRSPSYKTRFGEVSKMFFDKKNTHQHQPFTTGLPVCTEMNRKKSAECRESEFSSTTASSRLYVQDWGMSSEPIGFPPGGSDDISIKVRQKRRAEGTHGTRL